MPPIGFTTGILQVQFSNTIPLPVNTVTIAGEGMTMYMFGYGVIPKNHTGRVWDGGGASRRGGACRNASGCIEGGHGICVRSWLGLGHMKGMWDACGMVAAR